MMNQNETLSKRWFTPQAVYEAFNVLEEEEQEIVLDWIGSDLKELEKAVSSYIVQSEGIIDVRNMFTELHITTKEEKSELRIVLRWFCISGVLERVGKKNGVFRKIDKAVEVIDWQNATISPVPITFPMDLHHEVVIEKGSVVAIAGVSNAGKSGWLLETAIMNCKHMKVSYFASEWSDSGLKQRLEGFGEDMDVWPNVNFIKRTKNFADVLDPDGLNIVDFLETHDDFWAVSGEIQKYHEKLNDGVVIVALQKNPGSAFGKGGHGTVEKSQLYLTIDDGIMTIVKLKQPQEGRKNLSGMSINYSYGKGGRLEKDGLWGRIEMKKRRDQEPVKSVVSETWANEPYDKNRVEWR